MTDHGTFSVWAPSRSRVRLVVEGDGGGVVDMRRGIDGWWSPLELPPRALEPGADYGFMLDDDPHPYPDPRSRRQPGGVHELSRTYDASSFAWPDQGWTGRQLAGSVVYELHIGTFTADGTLDSATERLDHLRSIGVDLVELMPVNAFNGTHNWGYDGVGWFAVSEQYGGPPAYQRFVDACHAAGLGVVQDVVYNHLGPSGNYLPLFGPYLKQGRNTWGDLVNLDGEGSAEVRRFVLDNLRMWFEDYHVDALRLDAVHALVDSAPVHILEEMAIETQALSAHLRQAADADRRVRPQRRPPGHTARSGRLRPRRPVERRLPPRPARRADRRDVRLLRRLRAAVGAGQGLREGLLPRRHLVVVPGQATTVLPLDTDHLPTWRLVVSNQNHDQIGNRARGDRLTEHLDDDQLACAALLTLCGPFTPMLFMGEEWAASTPFQFFTSHPEQDLGRGDRRGPARGVRADGLGPVGGPRPAGPRDVRAVAAGLVGARDRPARRTPRRLPTPGRAAPRAAGADRPRLRRPRRGGGRDFEGVHAAPFGPAAGGELRATARPPWPCPALSCSRHPAARPSPPRDFSLPPHAGALLRLDAMSV